MASFDLVNPPSPKTIIDPQRRAWGIMLISFAVFCTICLVSGVGITYFLFQSAVPLDAMMQVGRGSGGISGQEAVRLNGVVSTTDTLSTDILSQATLSLRDGLDNHQMVTAVTLRGETSLKLARGSRPRYQWSSGQYIVELQDFTGELNIFAPGKLSRELQLSIITRAGDLIYLRSGGQYILRASDTRVQVINQDGDVILKPSNVDVGKSIPINSQGTINYTVNPQEVVLSQSYTNLLSEGVFQDVIREPSDPDTTGQPFLKDWVCKDNSDPVGQALPGIVDGRAVLRLIRADNATSHGETGCVRSWGTDGQNVASFNYLSLRANFRINYQSLSTCGQDGSECPLMLLVEYRDQKGILRRWYHGFYARVDPDRNFPLQCNSCLQEHERVYEKAWFTYDSGNLLNLISNPDQLAEQRPVAIVDVQFKASGHQYDVEISDLALFADLNPNP